MIIGKEGVTDGDSTRKNLRDAHELKLFKT